MSKKAVYLVKTIQSFFLAHTMIDKLSGFDKTDDKSCQI